MSNERDKSLGECDRRNRVLEITCGKCLRTRYLLPGTVMRPPEPGRKGWPGSTPVGDIVPHLRCRCGARDAKLAVITPKIPNGVPLIAFLNADDRERQRLIRIARN